MGVVQTTQSSGYDVHAVRGDFPILQTRIGEHALVYLDNGATTQKPKAVIDTLSSFFLNENANIHRGVHALSQRATDAYEESREVIARFINAPDHRSVIFTKGATESVNLVAQTFGRKNIGQGDNVVITAMEHHANIVPWQLLCEERGAELRVTPVSDAGELDLEAFARMIDERTKLVSFVHVSNSLGTVNPAKEMIATAHAKGVPVLLDAAQSIQHLTVDVVDLDCDFMVFSGHKLYGPTGIGILYGKPSILQNLPPWQGGGDMIKSVSFEKSTFKGIPERFEAGTPPIAEAIGLGAAVEYLEKLGRPAVEAYETELLAYAINQLQGIKGMRFIGTAKHRAAVCSFLLADVHPHDIGTFLDADGIAIRAGHHCTQPLMKRLGIPGTARASFALYNTREEVDKLALGLDKIVHFFKV